MDRRIVLAIATVALAGCSMFGTSADKAPVYIVFFHYDSDFLTPDARRIVDQAAASARDTKPTTIELAGYTEATAAKNSRQFAEPRFNAVADALIVDGVDPKLLVRVPLMDSEASLPSTADRRVEIRLINKTQQ
jgi:outer membrane protein OmpA-like peptidoglycan-associated protein